MKRARRLLAVLSILAFGASAMPMQGVVDAAPQPRVIRPQQPGHPRITQSHVNLWPRYQGSRVVVQIWGKNFRHGGFDGVDLWIGTKHGPKRAARPEYRLVWFLPNSGDGLNDLQLYRVGGFGAKTSTRISGCNRMYARKHLKRGYVELSVPLRCIGGGKPPIKINATTWNFTKYNNQGWPVEGKYHSSPRYKQLSRKF